MFTLFRPRQQQQQVLTDLEAHQNEFKPVLDQLELRKQTIIHRKSDGVRKQMVQLERDNERLRSAGHDKDRQIEKHVYKIKEFKEQLQQVTDQYNSKVMLVNAQNKHMDTLKKRCVHLNRLKKELMDDLKQLENLFIRRAKASLIGTKRNRDQLEDVLIENQERRVTETDAETEIETETETYTETSDLEEGEIPEDDGAYKKSRPFKIDLVDKLTRNTSMTLT